MVCDGIVRPMRCSRAIFMPNSNIGGVCESRDMIYNGYVGHTLKT